MNFEFEHHPHLLFSGSGDLGTGSLPITTSGAQPASDLAWSSRATADDFGFGGGDFKTLMDMLESSDNISLADGEEGLFSGESLQDVIARYRQFQNLTQDGLNQPPLEMAPEEQKVLNILYGTAIAIAVAGNLSVILVFLFGRRWKSDLSVFLVNLAFSDVILAVFCMPFTMSQVVKHHWQFPDALCPIVLFLQLSSVLTSVYTLVAIGLDRYLFVTRPLKARLTKRKGKMVVIIIWFISLGLSSVQVNIGSTAVIQC